MQEGRGNKEKWNPENVSPNRDKRRVGSKDESGPINIPQGRRIRASEQKIC